MVEGETVSIRGPKQEFAVPEYNLLQEKFQDLFYRVGLITHPSVTRVKKEEEPQVFERSLLTRSVRTDLLRRFKSIGGSTCSGRNRQTVS